MHKWHANLAIQEISRWLPTAIGAKRIKVWYLRRATKRATLVIVWCEETREICDCRFGAPRSLLIVVLVALVNFGRGDSEKPQIWGDQKMRCDESSYAARSGCWSRATDRANTQTTRRWMSTGRARLQCDRTADSSLICISYSPRASPLLSSRTAALDLVLHARPQLAFLGLFVTLPVIGIKINERYRKNGQKKKIQFLREKSSGRSEELERLDAIRV